MLVETFAITGYLWYWTLTVCIGASNGGLLCTPPQESERTYPTEIECLVAVEAMAWMWDHWRAWPIGPACHPDFEGRGEPYHG